MGSVSPVAIALLILCAVGFVGAFLAFFRDRRTYSGHQDYAEDARTLAKRLRGELFRDGDDLVVSGNLGRLPAVIRFSYTETTPGMNIRVEAPANFTMSIVPKGARATEGRVLVRTPDDMFDARFVTRSDHPTQAKMLLSGRKIMPLLQKLCCSSKTFLTVANGGIELSELAIPYPYTLRHINDHLDQITALASEIGRMPGAETVAVKPMTRDRRLLLRVAILVGIIAALVGVITASKTPPEVPISEIAPSDSLPEGVMPLDALHIGGLKDWRLATDADLEPDAVAWVRTFGVRSFGRVDANLDGDPETHDAGYVFIDEQGQRRVVVVVAGQNRYDIKHPFIGAMAKVPKSSFSNIEWLGRPAEEPDGDGLLIVRKPNDHASGLVLFFSAGRLASAAPADYQAIKLVE